MSYIIPNDGTEITIAETNVAVSVTENVTTLNIVPAVTTVEAKGLAIALSDSAAMGVTPYGTITATNVQAALNQLADQDFRSTSTPTGTNVSEGDTWYDTDDNILKVYREVSSNVFAWTNVVVADTNELLDAGAF
jgi:thiamine monophosphate kinase|tara:strand:- start:1084 stop:1488 length:405 start_codon:yes stop_codon:yes gene_type:complete